MNSDGTGQTESMQKKTIVNQVIILRLGHQMARWSFILYTYFL